jgi:hypothetical protein
MWTLIKREIKDNIIMFLLALILAGTCEAVVVSGFLRTDVQFAPVGIPLGAYTIFPFFIISLCLLAVTMGGVQMYLDKSRKISAFLSSLAVTRRGLLSAKLLVGIIWLVVALLPLVAAELLLFKVRPRLIPADYIFLVRIYIVTALCALSCYLLGLNLGLGRNRIVAILGGALLCLILMSVIVIKGLDADIMLIFGITSAAIAVRAWNIFMSIPL